VSTSPASRSYDFLWLSLALLPLLLIAFLLPLTPHDYWWYLRLGREVLQTGSVPSADTYSYTFAGEPVVNQPWLAAVFFWLLYARGGLTLTFLARGLVVGGVRPAWKWKQRRLGAAGFDPVVMWPRGNNWSIVRRCSPSRFSC
jgi:hypothetical protein